LPIFLICWSIFSDSRSSFAFSISRALRRDAPSASSSFVYALCSSWGPLVGFRPHRQKASSRQPNRTLIGSSSWARHVDLADYLSRIIDARRRQHLDRAGLHLGQQRPEGQNKSFALIGIAFGLGFFIGPFSPVPRQVRLSAHYAACVMSLSSILCTSSCCRTRPDRRPRRDAADPGRRQTLAIFE